MAKHSVVVKIATGSSNQFSVSFTGGFIERDHVSVRVNNEVDGTGAPSYRTITWISDGILVAGGALAGAGEEVVFTRTTPILTAINDFVDGTVLSEASLDLSFVQLVNSAQEQDDRLDDTLTASLEADAAAASASAAASSAAAALVTESRIDLGALDASVATSAANAALTAADKVLTSADVILTHADVVLAAASQTAIDARATALEALSIAGVVRKELVLIATTANITLSGEQTIDGVLTSTSRILVKNQTAAADNGVYVTASGGWARAADMNTAAEIQGAAIFVSIGTISAGMTFYTGSAISALGTDAIVFIASENYAVLPISTATQTALDAAAVAPDFLQSLKRNCSDYSVHDVRILSSLWQDEARTTPVTSVGQSVRAIDDISGLGNHLTASDANSTYQINASGDPYVNVAVSTFFLVGRTTFPRPKTITVPAYVAAAFAAPMQVSRTLVALGSSNGSLLIRHNNNVETYLASSLSPSSGTDGVGTMSGTTATLQPKVLDIRVDEDFITSQHNGGGVVTPEREFDGGWKRIQSNWLAGESSIEGSWGLGTSGTGSTLGTLNYYGGVFAIGDVKPEARYQINEWLKGQVSLGGLKNSSYDTFLAIGQSNMLGQGDSSSSPAVPTGVALNYQSNGAFNFMADPVHHGRGGAATTGSLSPAFCNAWFAKTRSPVCVVGSAFSAEGLITAGPLGGWKASGPLLGIAAHQLKSAMSHLSSQTGGGRLRGVLYLGGEQDTPVAGTMTASEYEAVIVAFHERIKLFLCDQAVPLLLLSVDRRQDGLNDAGFTIIRQAMVDAAANNDGIYLVMPYQNFVGSGDMTDVIHWDQTALNAAGTLAGENAASMLGLEADV